MFYFRSWLVYYYTKAWTLQVALGYLGAPLKGLFHEVTKNDQMNQRYIQIDLRQGNRPLRQTSHTIAVAWTIQDAARLSKLSPFQHHWLSHNGHPWPLASMGFPVV